MRVGFQLALTIGIAVAAANAQDIRIYSEFERFDPFGNPVPQDRDMVPREVLSPAMARNGHLTVHVVVTAPAGANYFLYSGSNPPNIVQTTIYREYFTPCGNTFCPDWVVPQNSPAFGVIPELLHNSVRPAMDNQTTRSYLLDIWAPPDTPPRRVRVEALLKVGTWYVAPMEVRIVSARVPGLFEHDTATAPVHDDVTPLDAPSSQTAANQLFRYLGGLAPGFPARLSRVRDFIQRNSAEDMLLARTFDRRVAGRRPTVTQGPVLPELNLLAWTPAIYPAVGAEWYLRVRDFLYRFDP